MCQHLQITHFALQVFHKDEFGNLLSSLSTLLFPDLTELNLDIGVDLNSEGRDLRFIQVEETGVFSPLCSHVLKSSVH